MSLKKWIEQKNWLHHTLVLLAITIFLPPFDIEIIFIPFLKETFNLTIPQAIIITYAVAIIILLYLAPSSIKKVWAKITNA